jgi:hypothetical protein
MHGVTPDSRNRARHRCIDVFVSNIHFVDSRNEQVMREVKVGCSLMATIWHSASHPAHQRQAYAADLFLSFFYFIDRHFPERGHELDRQIDQSLRDD